MTAFGLPRICRDHANDGVSFIVASLIGQGAPTPKPRTRASRYFGIHLELVVVIQPIPPRSSLMFLIKCHLVTAWRLFSHILTLLRYLHGTLIAFSTLLCRAIFPESPQNPFSPRYSTEGS